MTDTLCRYIPHRKAAVYRLRGWIVTPLLGHHAQYSMLAVKKRLPKEEEASKKGSSSKSDMGMS
jgi:hypothetical protein